MSEVYYPRLLRRVQAMLIDSIVLTLIFYFDLFVINSFQIESGVIKACVLFLPVLCYDPVLVSFRGGTLGHLYIGLRVRDASVDKRLNIMIACLRYLLKLLLGMYSLVVIFFTKKHQALHDKLTHSIVILKHYKDLPEREVLEERIH